MLKKNVYIRSSTNKYDISCTIYLPESNNITQVIIACHGFGGDKESSAILLLAKSLTKNNICVIAFDFPGHGTSKTDGHDFSVKNCINDVNDVENYVRVNYKEAKIGFFATSFGAYVLMLKLNQSKNIYDKIVLRCPALNMRKTFEENILKEDLNEFLKRRETLLGYERKIVITKDFYQELIDNDIFKEYDNKNNILIIHGTKDDMAPIDFSVKLTNKFKDRIKLCKIEGANHRFKGEGEIEKVIDIATEYIMDKNFMLT